MTPEEARERYDVAVSHADDGDHVTAADGTELVVLVSAYDGTRKVVHADVVEYSGLGHPFVSGLAGFTALLGALMVPLAAGLLAALQVGGSFVAIVLTGVGLVSAYLFARFLLYDTLVYDWVSRFMEWNDHRALVISHRKKGEPA